MMKKLLAALALITMVPAQAGCSWWRSKEPAVKEAAIDCAKQDLGKTVTEAAQSIVLTVVAIIAKGGADWKSDLESLGAKYGVEAVLCAAQVAEALFRPAPATMPSTGDDPMAAAHARAAQMLVGKKFR